MDKNKKQHILFPTCEQEKNREKSSILMFQIYFCAFLFLIIWTFSALHPQKWSAFYTSAKDFFEYGISLSGTDEIARFTDEKAKNLSADSSDFCCYLPLLNYRISSRYGSRIHPITEKPDFHTGIDLAASIGSPVSAAFSGQVISCKSNAAAGNFVSLRHSENLITNYRHLQFFSVKEGETVRRGQNIGTVGSTGLSTGPHLHFELLYKGNPINPIILLLIGNRT